MRDIEPAHAVRNDCPGSLRSATSTHTLIAPPTSRRCASRTGQAPPDAALTRRRLGKRPDDTCGVIPNALDNVDELYPRGIARGSVCVSVPVEQLAGAHWIVDVSYGGEESEAFVSLQ